MSEQSSPVMISPTGATEEGSPNQLRSDLSTNTTNTTSSNTSHSMLTSTHNRSPNSVSLHAAFADDSANTTITISDTAGTYSNPGFVRDDVTTPSRSSGLLRNYLNRFRGHTAGFKGNKAKGEDASELGADEMSTVASMNNAGEETYGVHADGHLKKISTFETLPTAEHYESMITKGVSGGRPSLSKLHGDLSLVEPEISLEGGIVTSDILSEKEMGISQGPKFGWIKGVVVRCLLNIWGVMLFLRLSWVVGQAGIGLSSIIILLSMLVIIITAMSMAAICTNGEVKGGGCYYMISRSLGPEFGGAIGIIFSLANAATVSMNVVGVAETIVDLLNRHAGTTYGISEPNWVRIIGCATSVLLLLVLMMGMEWETKTQVGFLILLLLSFLVYFVGTVVPPTPFKKSRGVIGYNRYIFRENFGPGFQGETFFSVFAIFFPSFTGFLAGANISGDLKDAQTAIPKGTFWAIFFTSSSYLLMAWCFGSTMLRDATGNINDLYGPNNTLLPVSVLIQPDSRLRTCGNSPCKFGLLHDYQAAELQSIVGPLITLGIFAACLSSALASLEGASKVFQALCRDNLFPYIEFFSVGTKRHDEPFRAYFLMFFIAILFILMANLNALAPIISNFFLMSFALINYSCFDVYMSGSVGFRPGYSYYNHWVSLFGGILCLVTMFLIQWWATLITFFFIFFLYAYVHYKKPDVNWGSSTQAHVYKNALSWVLKLNQTEEHVKNFRPQILVLSGDPRDRPTLVDFVNYFTKNLSLLICGHVLLENSPEYNDPPKVKTIDDFFIKRKVKALYDTIRAPNLRQGTFCLLEVAGLGRLKPNILIMGYMANWRDEELADVNNYFYIIHDAFDLRFGVGILRMPEGLDFSFFLSGNKGPRKSLIRPSIFTNDLKEMNAARRLLHKWGRTILSRKSKDDTHVRTVEDDMRINKARKFGGKVGVPHRDIIQSAAVHPEDVLRKMSKKYSRNILSSINQFQIKQRKGNIDVWWLFDDGGLTVLLPYILAHRRHWENCKIRFFALSNGKIEQERIHQNFSSLLNKFRIDYSDLIVLPDIEKMPYPSSLEEFQEIIQKYRVPDEHDKRYNPGMVTDGEYMAQLDKTNRHIRLHEMLTNNSLGANLIVITLPMPRKGSVSTALYMSWLEIISKSMPPIFFLRGNQQSVITYYS